jgi:hypothetical protein
LRRSPDPDTRAPGNRQNRRSQKSI